MLQESFVLLPRVKSVSERNIWRQGVKTWSDFLDRKRVKGFGKSRKALCEWRLRHARQRLAQDDFSFFAKALPFKEQWRLWDSFKEGACFLDIETDGYYGGVTVVGISDGYESATFVRGFNLDKYLIERALSNFSMVVTFNGASFDLPVLRRYFNLDIRLPHIDLRFVCQRAGYSGGLKSIERQLGIRRRSEVANMQGDDAVYLWQMFKSTGNREYLEKLVWYNEEDILNLLPIAKKVIPKLWSKVRSNC